MVISGKYPAWMLSHPNHRLYLLHRLRGLYDTYPFSVASQPSIAVAQAMEEVRQASAHVGSDRDRMRRILDVSRALVARTTDPAITAYPGPFARQIIHFLDNLAIGRRTMRKFSAISRTVADRQGYFPPGVAVDVLHPPPHRLDQRSAERRHLFTSSRLDHPKRIGLVIQAMRHLRHDVPLLIAGSGPELPVLQALAAGDPRISFLGRVSDEALLDLYAGAIAVPFVPFDEDYGLVTVEAMRSAAPVVTCVDSGGPTEFVDDGETGYVTAPEPQALADALGRLLDDRDRAAAMGEAAKLKVASVAWEPVVEGILATPHSYLRRSQPKDAEPARPKLVLAATLPIYPPQGGGQIRVFQLYRHLARQFEIELVTVGPAGMRPVRLALAPGLTETRIPLAPLHANLEWKLSTAAGGVPVTDVIIPKLIGLTPAFRTALARASRGAAALIACHPYLVRELQAVSTGQPLWFEAQDVELSLKRGVFHDIPGADAILAEVQAVEGEAWRAARLVFACTQGDLGDLETLYGATQAQMAVAPNGVALEEFPFTPWLERRERRMALGLNGQHMALFMGSWHPPNVDAAESLIELAAARPNLVCLVVGSVGHALKGRPLPGNLRLLGVISEAERSQLLSMVDVALNPMRYGSGSNLKMLDYLASGVPVVTTAFGIRGLDLNSELVAIAEREAFGDAIDMLLLEGDTALQSRTQAARAHVEKRFAWSEIAATLSIEMWRQLNDSRP
ncbi:MAG: glycosyltransferase family 4 protein [Beijerinckiaceae bacterium]